MRTGDRVTVIPLESDAYVLQFQRHATISRRAGEHVFYVRVSNTNPPDQEFGPIPANRLVPGWDTSW